jgi:hypothetical protein
MKKNQVASFLMQLSLQAESMGEHAISKTLQTIIQQQQQKHEIIPSSTLDVPTPSH